MSLSFYVSRTGAVICQNHRGLIFFLPGEPFNCVKAAKANPLVTLPPPGRAAREGAVGAPA
ncbi:hypothetical protein D3C72_2408640 [compost metagenome]